MPVSGTYHSDGSFTPASSKNSTTSKSSSASSGSSGSSKSSGGSSSNKSGSSSTQKVDTTGLSGYALSYASALNNAISGGSSLTAAQNAATAAANKAAYGSESGPNEAQSKSVLDKYGFTGVDQIILPEQPKAKQTDILSQILETINQPQTSLLPAPVYQQPDYSSLIPSPQQGVAATANAADTYFVPTTRYLDRVEQIKQNAADQAYKTYAANLDTWNSQNQLAQSARNTQLSTLASLIPSLTISPYHQATLDANKAATELKATVDQQAAERQATLDAWAKDPTNPDNIAKLAQAAYYTHQANAPYSSGSSGSGSGGTQTDRDRANYSSVLNGIYDSIDKLYTNYGTQAYANEFSTEDGMLAPIQVIEQNINKQAGYLRSVGVDPEKLINDAYSAVYGMGKEEYWNQFLVPGR